MPLPMNKIPTRVEVEYTSKGQRVSKWFATAPQARRFYAAKYQAGLNPRIKAAHEEYPMSENTTTAIEAASSTPAPKPAKKVTAKKTAAKKAPAPAKKSATSAPREAQYGVERSHDLPWNDKKVAVFKALKKLNAVGESNAVQANKVAEKAGVSTRDVRHYVYHAATTGLTGVAKQEDVAGYCYYLTAKGAKVDPVAEQKAAANKS